MGKDCIVSAVMLLYSAAGNIQWYKKEEIIWFSDNWKLCLTFFGVYGNLSKVLLEA